MVTAINGIVGHLVPLLTDRGFALGQATATLSAVGLSTIAGRLVSGYLLDRFFAPYVAAALFLLPLAGVGILAAGPGGPALILAAIALGFGLGAEVDVIGFMVSRYFGLRSYGEIYGCRRGVRCKRSRRLAASVSRHQSPLRDGAPRALMTRPGSRHQRPKSRQSLHGRRPCATRTIVRPQLWQKMCSKGGVPSFDLPTDTASRIGGRSGAMPVGSLESVLVHGHVSPGFEAVREAFADNFARRGELGGACCAYLPRARRSSTSGAAARTSRPASRGSRTRWSSSTRPPRASRR